VIAVAASTIDTRRTRFLRPHSFVAWLDADVSVLADRPSRAGHRPLKRDVVAQLGEHAGRRSELYRGIADIIIDAIEHDA
jgi:shikimate kinase